LNFNWSSYRLSVTVFTIICYPRCKTILEAYFFLYFFLVSIFVLFILCLNITRVVPLYCRLSKICTINLMTKLPTVVDICYSLQHSLKVTAVRDFMSPKTDLMWNVPCFVGSRVHQFLMNSNVLILKKVAGNPQIGNNPFSNSEQVVDNPIKML
jgi:hypothetical protein